MQRGSYLRHPAVARHPLDVAGSVSPVAATIFSQLDHAVIGACPDNSLPEAAGGDCQYGTVVFSSGGFKGNTPALILFLLLRVIGGKVRRNLCPGVAPVAALMHKLAPEIDSVVIEGILCQC